MIKYGFWQQKHRISRIYQMAAICLLISFVAGGCSKGQKAPKLEEPVMEVSAYRAVVYGSAVHDEVMRGTVMPEEYCQFMEKSVTIDQIKVNYGDYVKKGQLLATLEVKEVKRSYRLEQKHYQFLLQKKKTQKQIAQEQIKYQRMQKNKTDDAAAKKECEKQIALLRENARYEAEKIEDEIKQSNKNMHEWQSVLEKECLYANHNGYVSYIKNTTTGSEVAAYENIVILGDTGKLHIALEEKFDSERYQKLIEKKDKEIFIYANGVPQQLCLHHYTSAQKNAMQLAEKYPHARLDFVSDTEIRAGEQVLVFFRDASSQDKLIIGTDSLYQEGERYFVYVWQGSEKEKREVEVDKIGNEYTSIKSGLKEGDKVFYTVSESIPETKKRYHVRRGSFGTPEEEERQVPREVYTKGRQYFQEEPATVKRLYVKEGDAVQKGQLLCTLSVDAGGAELRELEYRIREAERQEQRQRQSFLVEQRKLKKQKELSAKEKNCQMRILMLEQKIASEEFAYSMEEMKQTRENLLSKRNGEGLRKLYASETGIVQDLKIEQGSEIIPEQGSLLFVLLEEKSKVYAFPMISDIPVAGAEVLVEDADGPDTYIGRVTGNVFTTDTYYLSRQGKRACLTENRAGENDMVYFTVDKMKSVKDKRIKNTGGELHDVVVIPSALLKREKSDYDDAPVKYYVWKIEENQAIKQYVQIVESDDQLQENVCICAGLQEGDELADTSTTNIK